METKNFLESLHSKIIEELKQSKVPELLARQIDDIIYILVIAIIALIVGKTAHLLVTKIAQRIQKRKRYTLLCKLVEFNVHKRLAATVPPLIILALLPMAFNDQTKLIYIIENITWVYFSISIIRSLIAVFSSVGDTAYSNQKYHDKPIKGLIQIAKIVTYIIGSLIIISILTNKSPYYLIGGLGAFAAVLMLIFKDTILGFVSGIQLLENDMIRLGDWIEMPQSAIDGIVIDISLTIVKVKNFDNTIVTIPPYSLISSSFINWRAMSESGGRRIMNGYTIKIDTIKECNAEFIERIKNTSTDIERFINHMINPQDSTTALSEEEKKYGTVETNLGLFRAYVTYYLKRHPDLHKEMLTMVRVLPPNEYGLPLQIYCFSNDTNWSHYESVQSAIMEHLAAIMLLFDLLPYQSSSSHDSMINGLVERDFPLGEIRGIPCGVLHK